GEEVQGPTGDGHGVGGPGRGGEIPYEGGNPGFGWGRRWHRRDRRATVLEPAAPADPRRLAAGRQRAAAEPHCPQPPAVAGPLPRPGQAARRRDGRAGGPEVGHQAAGGRPLARPAAAPPAPRPPARSPAALSGAPPTLMLGDPSNGMDPEGIVCMRGFLRALAAEGRAVLVSSHLMSELQDTADHLVVVGRGKVIADTSVKDLIAAASG